MSIQYSCSKWFHDEYFGFVNGKFYHFLIKKIFSNDFKLQSILGCKLKAKFLTP